MLLLLVLPLCSACSKVNISNLRAQAGPDTDGLRLEAMQTFDLLPVDAESPFSEELALDAIKNNLLARGYRHDPANPDFLVAAWYNLTWRAEAHIAPPFGRAMGWPYPYSSRYNPFWQGFALYGSGGYTVLNNYASMAIAFLNPASQEQIKQNLNNPENSRPVPETAIYWIGRASTKSSRNAFSVLSCLSAGILEEFPHAAEIESKSVELALCH
ncbi:MAG: DUF4136 domain-containing protein [Desulfovibrionaceae bacterium]|nr:DUF4136 domain-containing protein [Desulfovibrionaceae bacterium]